MNNSDTLSLIIEWQKILMSRAGIHRDLTEDILKTIPSKPIKIITGFRRCGKSFLTQQIAKHLVEIKQIELENVLYLNFEDYRLTEINSAEKLDDVYSVFVQQSAKEGKKFLIFDEIQYVQHWDKFIRTIYEKTDQTEILITGSNSEMLSSELGSNLAGRYIEFFLYPFSFKEFLSYKKVMLKNKNDVIRYRPELQTLFNEYLTYGGLPETIDIQTDSAKISYLKGIITKVILDDIVKRFSIGNVDVLEKILAYLMSNIGHVISFAALTEYLKSLRIQMKTETVIHYVSCFKKAFALEEVNKFSWKLNKIFSSGKKYYAIDTGLLTMYRSLHENYSFRLENLIFLQLKRMIQTSIYYGVDTNLREIDFLIESKPKIWDKYQVTISLTPENQKRELGAFQLADKYLEKGKNILLTLEKSKTDLSDLPATIQIVDIINFLVEPNL